MSDSLEFHAMCIITETGKPHLINGVQQKLYRVHHELSTEAILAVGRDDALRIAELLDFKHTLQLAFLNKEFTERLWKEIK